MMATALTATEPPEAVGSAIRMNDFKRQWAETGAEVVAAVSQVGASGWYVLGEEVTVFEAALATGLERAFVVGCASGLDAIEIGLRALGLRPGDRVLTTPLSAFATTLGIVRAGGVPVFVDVDRSGLLDLDLVEAALDEQPAPRFMVPVHLYGLALDLEGLAAIRARFGVRILEDAAQAIGACFAGRAVGSVGEICALSFYPTKNLGALGDGGAVATDDAALRAACQALRDYGQTEKYVHTVLGLNSRLDELHAAVLHRVFLPRLDRWTARRRAIARAYLEGIDSPLVRALPLESGSEPVWHLFPVRVNADRRDDFMAYLRRTGIESAVHYPRLICDQRALEGTAYELHGSLDRARAIAREEVSLPIHPYLDDAEVARVVDTVNAWR
jgi:dTDP-3-amino-3,4,6-trideoxy-alpha-D-glucose transaminase